MLAGKPLAHDRHNACSVPPIAMTAASSQLPAAVRDSPAALACGAISALDPRRRACDRRRLAVAFSPSVHRLGHRADRRAAGKLLPSPPGLGRHRRDADHRRPRRPAHYARVLAGRARLSAGAHAEAARPGARRDRDGARHRALHAGRSRAVEPAGSEAAASSAFPACRCSSRCSACSSPISAPQTAPRVGAQHMLDARLFQPHRRAELHHDARRRPARRRSRRGRRRPGRHQPHLEDADRDLSRQSRHQDRQHAAGARHSAAAPARHRRRSRWSSAWSPAPSASSQIRAEPHARPQRRRRPTTPMSTARSIAEEMAFTASSAPATTGR